MFELGQYDERKKAGLIEIEKSGDGFLILSQKFNPLTGAPDGRMTVSLTRAQVLDQQRAYTAQLEKTRQDADAQINRIEKDVLPGIEMLLKDMDGLDAAEKKDKKDKKS